MQKHFLKFSKVFTNITCSPLILLLNNSELAAKYLPNDFEQKIITLEINKKNNNGLFQGLDINQDKNFFKDIQLQLVDFKLEFGYNFKNNIVLGDEISPDNCRLWDLNQKNDTIVSLDKDRFRNDLGGLIEAYSEINRRIHDFI